MLGPLGGGSTQTEPSGRLAVGENGGVPAQGVSRPRGLVLQHPGTHLPMARAGGGRGPGAGCPGRPGCPGGVSAVSPSLRQSRRGCYTTGGWRLRRRHAALAALPFNPGITLGQSFRALGAELSSCAPGRAAPAGQAAVQPRPLGHGRGGGPRRRATQRAPLCTASVFQLSRSLFFPPSTPPIHAGRGSQRLRRVAKGFLDYSFATSCPATPRPCTRRRWAARWTPSCSSRCDTALGTRDGGCQTATRAAGERTATQRAAEDAPGDTAHEPGIRAITGVRSRRGGWTPWPCSQCLRCLGRRVAQRVGPAYGVERPSEEFPLQLCWHDSASGAHCRFRNAASMRPLLLQPLALLLQLHRQATCWPQQRTHASCAQAASSPPPCHDANTSAALATPSRASCSWRTSRETPACRTASSTSTTRRRGRRR